MIACAPYGVARDILDALLPELALTQGGAADRSFVCSHGAPAIEFCARGTAYVGIRSVRPKPPGGKCVTVWVADLEVGVARCYPVARDNGPPPEGEVEAAAQDVADDLLALTRAVADIKHADIVSLATTPPRGGVHGAVMALSVEVAMAGGYSPWVP